MGKKHHYMTYSERCKLEAYLKAKKPVTWIAKTMGFSERTIYYEKKRGAVNLIRNRHGIPIDVKEYSADKAQMLHDYNQAVKGRPLKIGNNHAYADFLEQKILNDKYSPAAALAAAKRKNFPTSICVATLYSYIDKQIFLHLTNRNLLAKGKRKQQKCRTIKRIAHPNLPNIEQRPKHIADRTEPGHWEMDLIVGKSGTKAALLTLTERVTREEIIRKIPNKKSESVIAALNQIERSTPNFRKKFRSITTDNGPEFLDYNRMRRSIYRGTRFEIWYCHSYAAWEKGTVERNNRIIRRFFPKGTDFTKITKKQVAAVQDWMNNYPRKILDWKSPAEISA